MAEITKKCVRVYVFTGWKSGSEISMHGFPVFPWSEPKYPSL